MTTLFYLMSGVFFAFEIYTVVQSKAYIEFIEKLKNKGTWENEKGLAVQGLLWIALNILYLIWAIAGLILCPNWKLFGLLFLISILKAAASKIIKNNFWRSKLYLIDGVSSAIVLLAIFIDYFF
jgi:hypothetical protein